LGSRKGDKAEMSCLEILRNPMLEFEKNELALAIEQNNLKSYW
jgi:hypothetical protein